MWSQKYSVWNGVCAQSGGKQKYWIYIQFGEEQSWYTVTVINAQI